ncbi:hypothetical protein LOAG_12549 [Loa loa]|uniref:Uncharacterized protein n=1 Tax=Loa loa TaxID=7209 RepID=A0A1S0TLH5_LOALO|nr:hypothetical protein LOAG_12549 [Loa loa]EFO15959.2 hypothetical protein LOAG_12549 [Loa loa]
MSYFLRNFDLLESRTSTASSNVSLHPSKENNFVLPKVTSSQYAQLLKYCAKLPQRGHILRFPTIRRRSMCASTDFDSK